VDHIRPCHQIFCHILLSEQIEQHAPDRFDVDPSIFPSWNKSDEQKQTKEQTSHKHEIKTECQYFVRKGDNSQASIQKMRVQDEQNTRYFITLYNTYLPIILAKSPRFSIRSLSPFFVSDFIVEDSETASPVAFSIMDKRADGWMDDV
jgi:hypothetical protein